MILPSINNPQNLGDIESKVSMVVGHVKRVHLDISDGMFTPSFTWPLNHPDGRMADPDWQAIVKGEITLPFIDQVEYEVHLMVQDPEEYLDQWIAAGVTAIIAHASMIEAPHNMHQKLQTAGVKFGIAVTPIEYQIVDDVLFELADFIVVMGSNKVGYSGEKLTDESLKLIKELSSMIKKPIEIDIGVNKETIGKLGKAGATRFVSGTAIFKSPNQGHAIDDLEKKSDNKS